MSEDAALSGPRPNGTALPAVPDETALDVFPAISHAKKRAFLLTYAGCGSIRQSCRVTQMDHGSHYYWLEHDAAYVEAFAQAKAMAGQSLLDVAYERATRADSPSDTLLIFLIKGMFPEYRDPARHAAPTDVSALLKAVLLELVDHHPPPRPVTPEADWAPLPPGPGSRLPPPPAGDEEEAAHG